MIKLGRSAEPYKTRKTLETKDKIRREYKVPLPDERILFGPVAVDLVAKHENSGKLGLECREELITVWRKNRSRYAEEKISAAKRLHVILRRFSLMECGNTTFSGKRP